MVRESIHSVQDWIVMVGIGKTNTVAAMLLRHIRCFLAVGRVSGDLCALEIEPLLPTRTAALLTRKGACRSVAARAFIDRMLAHRDRSER